MQDHSIKIIVQLYLQIEMKKIVDKVIWKENYGWIIRSTPYQRGGEEWGIKLPAFGSTAKT